jgi:hypothetical protein
MAKDGGPSCETNDDDSRRRVLLIYCPTIELGQGKIEVTTRMKDLALMGFVPVAIARSNPADIFDFSIYATDGLPNSMKTAVFNDSVKIVLEALEKSEVEKHDRCKSNQ